MIDCPLARSSALENVETFSRSMFRQFINVLSRGEGCFFQSRIEWRFTIAMFVIQLGLGLVVLWHRSFPILPAVGFSDV